MQNSVQTITSMPQAVPQMLVGWELGLNPPQQLVLSGDRHSKQFHILTREVYRRFLPHLSVLSKEDCPMAFPGNDGQPVAYLCKDFVCELPVTESTALARLLDTLN